MSKFDHDDGRTDNWFQLRRWSQTGKLFYCNEVYMNATISEFDRKDFREFRNKRSMVSIAMMFAIVNDRNNRWWWGLLERKQRKINNNQLACDCWRVLLQCKDTCTHNTQRFCLVWRDSKISLICSRQSPGYREKSQRGFRESDRLVQLTWLVLYSPKHIVAVHNNILDRVLSRHTWLLPGYKGESTIHLW